MKSIFSFDGPLFAFVERIGNLMILNFLFLVCSLPIVTIGPAMTAMHYVTLKMARDEEEMILKPFLHSFKQNLKQGIVVGLITFAAGAFLAYDLYIIYQLMMTGGFLDKVIFVVILLAFIVYWMITVYIYPMLARYDNSTKQMFRTAALLAVRHLPATVCMGIISLAPVILLMYTPTTFLVALLFYMVLGFATVAFLQDKLMVRIFAQYPSDDKQNDTASEENNDA